MSKELKVGVVSGAPNPIKQMLFESIKSNDQEIQIVVEPYAETRKRVCCNCGNNIRIKDDKDMVVENRCDIDNHYIGYCECFEHWCNRWRKDRKWQ